MQKLTASLISNLASLQNNKQLNANLPMLLQVLSKKNADTFLVQLGKLIIETKSNKDLIVGAKYWASVAQDSKGILINNLVQQPKLMQNLQDSKFKLSSKDLNLLLDEAKKGDTKLENIFKDFLLDRLALSQSKQDFLELSNLLLGLQNGILSIAIKDEEKDMLLQVKSKTTHLDFYCLFQHLGQISGLISLEDNELNLRMQVMSKRIKDNLEDNLESLKRFSKVIIEVNEATALWDLSNFNGDNILNIRA